MQVKLSFDDSLKQLEGHLDENAAWIRPDLAPGTSAWQTNTKEEIAVLLVVCPCGCGNVASLPVKPGYGGAYWVWDGNVEKPTLRPSIFRSAGCPARWHGFLTAGVFESC